MCTALPLALLALAGSLGPSCGDPVPAFIVAASSDDLATPGDFTVQADRIILGESIVLTGLTWRGIYFDSSPCGPLPDDFFINVFEGGSTDPAVDQRVHHSNVGSVSRRATGQTRLGRDEYTYTVDLPEPLVMQAGVPYWIEVYNNAPPVSCDWRWVTDTRGDLVSSGGLLSGDEYIYNSPWAFDFALCLQAGSPAVPATSTWMLIALSAGLTVAAAGVLRRRAGCRDPRPTCQRA